jgi:type VI secretion system secreted protein Hcp
MRLFCFLGLASVLSLTAAPAVAAVDAFLKFDSIQGESAERPGWVDVKSVQFGAGRGASSATGRSADREASAPSVSEIKITRAIDQASPKLAQCIKRGCHFGTVLLAMRKAGGGKAVYLEYKLTNVWVSSYSMSSGGDRPMESVSLNFSKIELSPQSGPKSDEPIQTTSLPPGAHTAATGAAGLPPPGH